MDNEEIIKMIWCFKKKGKSVNNIHEFSGNVVDLIMYKSMAKLSTDNVSAIFIAFRNFENKNNAFYFCGHFCDISGRGFHPLETCAARSTKKGGFSSPPFFVRSSQPIP